MLGCLLAAAALLLNWLLAAAAFLIFLNGDWGCWRLENVKWKETIGGC